MAFRFLDLGFRTLYYIIQGLRDYNTNTYPLKPLYKPNFRFIRNCLFHRMLDPPVSLGFRVFPKPTNPMYPRSLSYLQWRAQALAYTALKGTILLYPTAHAQAMHDCRNKRKCHNAPGLGLRGIKECAIILED